MERKDTGKLGEKLGVDFLLKRGFLILETNYRCPEGEVDIVARDHDSLVFVEVRTKTGTGFCSPEESVTRAKKGRLIAAANRYRQTHDDIPPSWRIDFIAVELDGSGKPKRLELIENAISES